MPLPSSDSSSGGRAQRLAWLSYWAPPVLYCAVIFGLSSASSVPGMGHISDKVGHAVLYAGLGFLLARALSGGGHGRLSIGLSLAAIVLAGVYGLSDEAHQLFVPNRQFDLKDLAADLGGATLGTAGLWLWGIIRPRSGGSRPA